MLQPSYTQLMKRLSDEGTSKLTSRYSIVIAAARRARSIIDIVNEQAALNKEADKTGERVISPSRLRQSSELNEQLKTKKPVSIAVDEIYSGKILMSEYHSEEEEIAQQE